MAEVTIKQLLEAGVHFGHQTQRWNPKMKKYIFGERNGIYIINLEITLECLKNALAFLKQTALSGADVLLVGTKKQAQSHLKEAAELCDMPYVEQRWLGGMLTNYETVRKSIAKMDRIDQMEKDGSFQFMKKKEVLMLTRERDKLSKNLKGVRKMRKLPAALFVIDSKKEEIAIKEAVKLGIPVVSVIDTNCNPDPIDYPIPGNDDAIRAIKLICGVVSQALKEGRDEFRKIKADIADAKAKEISDQEASAEAASLVDEDLELPVESKVEVMAEQFAPVVVAQGDETSKLKSKKIIRK
ncbi:MAG: 30S ribosomal protein S2 [Candidatus Omnitrophica bacterium]|nr:30S ribosomal protein S2 [Candidatus Omnitrophota bacterium]